MSFAPNSLKTFFAVTGLALAAPFACAQGFDAVRLHSAAPGQDGGTIGAAVIAAPAYLGADQRRSLLLPLLDYQWAQGWFAGITNGVGVNLSRSPDRQFGLRVTPDLGRKQSRAEALRGMGDVPAGAEAGAFFNLLLPEGLALTSSVRYGSGSQHQGLVVDLGAAYATALAAQWRLSGGVGITLANARHMQSFFGVTAAQSATSGYAAYAPGAGARDARANVALTRMLSPRTSVAAVLSARRLLGDARNSPLNMQTTSATGVLAVAHAF
jgi:outer membrane scaffolding protein for murein synthesis (MipA/OmpV family)